MGQIPVGRKGQFRTISSCSVSESGLGIPAWGGGARCAPGALSGPFGGKDSDSSGTAKPHLPIEGPYGPSQCIRFDQSERPSATLGGRPCRAWQIPPMPISRNGSYLPEKNRIPAPPGLSNKPQ